MPRVMPNAHRARRGMTLVEIMISLVLLGIVSGVIMRVISRQQRFYQGVNQIITQRGQLRQATAVLPMDLRSLSSIGNDLIAVSDSALVFDLTIGTGIVCGFDGTGGNRVILPPVGVLWNKYMYTSNYGYDWDSEKNKGIWVYIYNDSNVVGNQDDRWQKFELKNVHGGNTTACLGLFTTLGDAGKVRPILELADPDGKTDPVTLGPISQWIGAGAPVRVVKRVRYKLYQDPDGKWYLGFSEYDKSGNNFGDLSPVSGPYEAYAGSGSTGLGFKFYDVDGNEIAAGADSASRTKVARVDLVVRAKTSSNVRAAGIQNGVSQQYKDSLAASVMIRNRQ